MKHFRIELTENRAERIEVIEPITPKAWLAATRRDGGEFVVLNGMSYRKEDVIHATKVKSHVRAAH